MKKNLIERNIIIIIIPMLFLVNHINNQYLTIAFFAVLIFFAFLKLRSMYKLDKEEKTNVTQKTILSTLVIAVVVLLFRFILIEYVYEKPF